MCHTAGWMVWLLVLTASSNAVADHPLVFPWSHGAHATTSAAGVSAPYQILHAAATGQQPSITLQAMSPKVGYAYGWFGSNPTTQVTRHLGFHQNYTQWKRSN